MIGVVVSGLMAAVFLATTTGVVEGLTGADDVTTAQGTIDELIQDIDGVCKSDSRTYWNTQISSIPDDSRIVFEGKEVRVEKDGETEPLATGQLKECEGVETGLTDDAGNPMIDTTGNYRIEEIEGADNRVEISVSVGGVT